MEIHASVETMVANFLLLKKCGHFADEQKKEKKNTLDNFEIKVLILQFICNEP